MTGKWKKACEIDSSMSLCQTHSGKTARCTVNSLLLTQTVFWITSQVSDAALYLRRLIPGTQGHNKWPSFVTLSLLIKSSCRAPWLMFDMSYSTMDVCQRDLSATERELSEHADIHNRRGTCFWAYEGPPHHLNACFPMTERLSWHLPSRSRLPRLLVSTSHPGNWDAKYGCTSLHSVFLGHLWMD